MCPHARFATFPLAAILALQSGVDAAIVEFNVDLASLSYIVYEFEVVIADTEMPSFDSVSMVLTWNEELGELLAPLTFEYAPSFLEQLTLGAPHPVPAGVYPSGDLLIGGNRFTYGGFVAPLLIGTLTVHAAPGPEFPWDIPDPVVSSALERELLGFPLSLIATGFNQEDIETVPEPTSLILMAIGAALVFRSRHDGSIGIDRMRNKP